MRAKLTILTDPLSSLQMYNNLQWPTNEIKSTPRAH